MCNLHRALQPPLASHAWSAPPFLPLPSTMQKLLMGPTMIRLDNPRSPLASTGPKSPERCRCNPLLDELTSFRQRQSEAASHAA